MFPYNIPPRAVGAEIRYERKRFSVYPLFIASGEEVVDNHTNPKAQRNRSLSKKIAVMMILAGVLVNAAPAYPEDAALRAKADAYEDRLRPWHVPGMGGVVQVVYDSLDLTNVLFYKGQGDSTFHTSMYLAAESFRYAVTGAADAQANAIAAVHTLQQHLLVTQTTGYISRYVGPIDVPYMLDYTGSDLVRYGQGLYLGKFWLGNTSSDQYVGWFFGMGVAYDLLDDQPTRDLIRSMVTEVIDKLRTHLWLIMDENGAPSPSAPNIDGAERMAFLLVAANVTGDPFYQQLYEQEFEAGKPMYPFWSFSYFNKYTDYFAFNLKHVNHYSMFRYEMDPDRRQFYLDNFSRDLVEWTHNAWFDYVWLHMIDANPDLDDVDAILADDLNTLTLFPSPPHGDSHKDIPLLAIDPVSQVFVDIQNALGLQDLLGFELQTKEPHEIQNRCNVEFLWQRKPYLRHQQET